MAIQGEYYYSEEGVYLNSKGDVVFGKDPDRKVEVVAPGGYVSMEIAKKYNLVTVQPEVVEEVAPSQPEQKAVTTAPANKALDMPKGKK